MQIRGIKRRIPISVLIIGIIFLCALMVRNPFRPDLKTVTAAQAQELNVPDYFPTEGEIREKNFYAPDGRVVSTCREVIRKEQNPSAQVYDGRREITVPEQPAQQSTVEKVTYRVDKEQIRQNEAAVLVNKPRWEEGETVRSLTGVGLTVTTPAGTFEHCVEVTVGKKKTAWYDFAALKDNDWQKEYWAPGQGNVLTLRKNAYSANFVTAEELARYQSPRNVAVTEESPSAAPQQAAGSQKINYEEQLPTSEMELAGLTVMVNDLDDARPLLGPSPSVRSLLGEQNNDTGILEYRNDGIKIFADMNHGGRLVYIEITDTGYRTAEGVKVGDTIAHVAAVYGKPYLQTEDRYEYNGSSSVYRNILKFYYDKKNGIVKRIVNSAMP